MRPSPSCSRRRSRSAPSRQRSSTTWHRWCCRAWPFPARRSGCRSTPRWTWCPPRGPTRSCCGRRTSPTTRMPSAAWHDASSAGSPARVPPGPAAGRAPRAAAALRRTRARPDLRRTIRSSLRTGGDPFERHWREPAERPRPLVLVCDVSGSMEPYARMLLQYMQACVAARRRVEAFVFGTRLTRVTAELAGRDPDRALDRAAAAAGDWSGGTRIGEALATLNREHGRRLGRGAIVVLLSDGWDRGDPEQLASEMARLQRCAHQLVWLNPLKAHPEYEPLTLGMQAALPHVDHFLAGNSLASLAELAELMEGGFEMKDVLEDVQAWVDRGERVAIATVVGVKRSAPRAPGAKMAVNDSGRRLGRRLRWMRGGRRRGGRGRGSAGSRTQAPALRNRRQRGVGCWTSVRRGNRCLCGGVPEVSLQSEFARIAATDGRAALVTVIAADPSSARSCWCAPMAAPRAASEATSSTARVARPRRSCSGPSAPRRASSATRSLFVDVVAPAPRLVIFGAVDYAAALCRLARAGGLAAVRVRPALAVRHARALPGRRGGHRRLAARRPSRDLAASTAPPTSPFSRTIRSSTTPRSRSRSVRRRVRRRHGQPARAGAAPRAAARGRARRGAARARRGADRARPRCGEPRGDGALDHVRGRGGQERSRAAGGSRMRPAASTRWARDRRTRARRRRRHPLRRAASSSRSSMAGRCSSTRCRR